MTRSDALRLLNSRRADIQRLFGVKTLAVFGSVARDEARADSDVDVLVVFEGRPRFDPYMELKAYLEELFAAPVDLATWNSIRPEMRPQIEREAVYVS
jgi:predicted nucleotidyltransferase